jgi:PAS domain S-box-containing protein
MTPALRVLQVAEFEPAAAAIFQRLAEADYACSVHRVDSEAALRAALAEGGWDLVVARVGAQPLGADAALAVLQATGSDIAFVTICDEAQEAAGARLMKAGARAYVTLDRLARFVPIAEREMREAEFRRERQRAQLALQESEERYRRITEAITDYIVTVRLEGGRVIETRHGAACEVVTGYRAAEFIGNPLLWIAMVVDADRAAVEAHARRAAAGEPVPPIEHRIIRKDGAERWVRHTVVFHRDGAGRISGYDGLIQDITERKRTETALRESEEKFSRMFYLSPDMLSLSRLDDGRIIDVNEGFTAVTGYARDEVVGRRSNRAELSLWAHEEDRERFIAMLKAQGATAPVEGPFRRKDGRIGIGQVSGRIIHLDGVPCVLALTRDITEQRRRDGELRKLSQAVEQSPLSIVITDAAGSIEYVNSGFTRATGYTAAEALGQNPRVLKSGLEPASLYTELWRTISAGGEWRGEFRNRKKNGEIYVEDATISAVKDEAGHITHYLAAKEDITLRKQAEELSAEALAFQQTLMERIPVGIITYRANGAVVSVNEYVARLIGTTVEEVKRQNFRQLDSWRSAGLDAVADRALATGQEQQIEVYLVSSFGRHIWLDARFVPFRFGGEPHLLGIFNDVSERKAVEERREQTLELLHLCNRATDARDLVRELTLFFQRVTGCEAVGLRLREGSDLPSFETRAGDRPIGDRGPVPGNAVAPGRGASFIGSADAGNPERSGESSRPNFTKNGSFWTNGTTDLLAGFAPGKLPLDAPDACPKDGFESVASIPLRGRHGSIGLLQCSDRRKDRFTAEKIAFLETQADYVAIALTKLD